MQAELCWKIRLPVLQPERAWGNTAGKTWKKPEVVKMCLLQGGKKWLCAWNEDMAMTGHTDSSFIDIL